MDEERVRLKSDPVLLTVRSATAADEEALAAIDRATWSTLMTPVPPPDEGWRFFDAKTAPADILVAVEGGVIAGYAKLGRATSLPASDHVVMVRGLAVDPAFQGRGIGRTLIEAAAAEARRRGARRLTLRVLGGNEVARRLYRSAGFATEGVLRGEFFLDGAYVDDVCMALDLT
jgi:ribosomal protein S18 acetylase RimI-like enzyme